MTSGLISRAYSHSFTKFVIVGAVGVAVNEGLLLALQAAGVYLLYASALAIELSILSNFFLNDLWTFKDRRSGSMVVRLAKFNGLMLLGLVVNAAVLDIGVEYFGMTAAIANLIGIGAAFALRYALSVRYAWMRLERIEEDERAGSNAPRLPDARTL
jgi:dolichol-phosphate mannosyltransferase